MKRVEQFPAKNHNPMICVGNDGVVLYSNSVGETLLHEWSVRVGEKVPPHIRDFVQRVISQNIPEKMEVKLGKRVYLIVLHPLPQEKYVSISGFDISDQKEFEEKLRESENRYRNIVETSVEGIWIFNAVSETIYVNEKMAEMLGYKPEEMIGRFIWDFAYEGDKDIFQIKLANRKQGIDEVYELKLIRKDGSPLCVFVSAKGLFDEAGKFAGSVGMFTDTTERMRAEKALLDSKARIESIFRSSPVGIGVVVDRRIKEANERLCEMTGYSREELLGKSALMLYPTVEEYERVGSAKYGMIGERGMGHVETRWQRKDGSIVDILLSSSPIVLGDLSGEITFTALDITERKHAEEALKKAHETLEEKVKERTAELEKAYNSLKESEKRLDEAQKMAHIGHWEWTIATDKSYWSNELYRIFGRAPHEPYPTYQEFLNYVHPDDRDYVNNAANRAMNGKPYSIDYRIFRTNGEERTVHMQSQVIFDENKIPIKVKGIVQDITEKKEAEKAFLKVVAAHKKEIHHRIKNNLQVISSLLDLQAVKFKNRGICINKSEVLEAFRESHDRVLSIALIHEELHEGEETDSLNFSLYIERLAENLLHTYRIGNSDITLNSDIKKDIFFDMDTAVPLGMIVNELISNSLKYAFSGRNTGEIQIKLYSEEAINNLDNKGELSEKVKRYTLTVSDNGVGIPENIDFENPNTLGLQLVNILVDQLDGKIELKRDKGTEFIVRFSVEEKRK